MRHKIMIAAGLLLMACGVADAAQCPIGMNMCSPGPNGRGGCFRPGYATCNAGAVCSSGMSYCARGSAGPGGCYRI